jgi:hypothetical protein
MSDRTIRFAFDDKTNAIIRVNDGIFLKVSRFTYHVSDIHTTRYRSFKI